MNISHTAIVCPSVRLREPLHLGPGAVGHFQLRFVADEICNGADGADPRPDSGVPAPPRPPRVPTKPGRGARERRLDAKRRRSETKRNRRWTGY